MEKQDWQYCNDCGEMVGLDHLIAPQAAPPPPDSLEKWAEAAAEVLAAIIADHEERVRVWNETQPARVTVMTQGRAILARARALGVGGR